MAAEAAAPPHPKDNPLAYDKKRSALRNFVNLLKQTLSDFSDDKASTFAASLAYYTVFSLAPTLVIALAIAGAVFGDDAARGAVQEQLKGILGETTAKGVQDLMVSAAVQKSGVFATIVGIIITLFAATGVFAEIQSALNTIWKAKPAPINTVLSFLKTRFLSIGVVLGIGFMLLVSLVFSALLSAFGSWVGNQLPGWTVVTQIINLLVSVGVITGLFGLMFKLLPDIKIAWRDVWLGAGISAGLFTVGKFLIALYIAKSAVASSYGAAGSMAALLVWVYYSSLTMLLGAELSHVYARTRGSLTEQPVSAEAPKMGAEAKVKEQEAKAAQHPASPVATGAGPVTGNVSPALEAGYDLVANHHKS